MKHILAAAIIFMAIAVQANAAKLDTDKSSGCSAKTLNGAYGFSWAGSAAFGAFNSVGILRFDGNGHLSETETISVAGQIIPNGGFPGTYTVKDDCSGNLVGQGAGFTVTADFVIVGNGTMIYMILTEPGTNVVGVFTKQ